MKKEMCIVLETECIQFNGNCIRILDSHRGRDKIPYRKIVTAFLRVTDKETGI